MQVSVQAVGHRFEGGPWLFRHLNIDLTAGHMYSLTGPSGTGKSTLLSLLAGWRTPREGTIVLPPGMRVSWVFQNPVGAPHRSARDHVALPFLGRRLPPREADRRADDLLGLFGLNDAGDRAFSDLSGGEAQRLMLARALASSPDLLLIDEPTAQLDRAAAETVNATVTNLAYGRAIVVVATHDPETRDACTDHLHLAGGNHTSTSA